VIYDIYAYARARQADEKGPFTKTYATAYRALVSPLSDLDAFARVKNEIMMVDFEV